MDDASVHQSRKSEERDLVFIKGSADFAHLFCRVPSCTARPTLLPVLFFVEITTLECGNCWKKKQTHKDLMAEKRSMMDLFLPAFALNVQRLENTAVANWFSKIFSFCSVRLHWNLGQRINFLRYTRAFCCPSILFRSLHLEKHICHHNCSLSLFCISDTVEDANIHTMDPCKCPWGISGTTSGTTFWRDCLLWSSDFRSALPTFLGDCDCQRVSEWSHAHFSVLSGLLMSEAAWVVLRSVVFGFPLVADSPADVLRLCVSFCLFVLQVFLSRFDGFWPQIFDSVFGDLRTSSP